MRVKGDLAVREDTGRINTSPVTTTQPIVRLQYNIRSYIALPGERLHGVKYYNYLIKTIAHADTST